jgi:golgi phosphoprotein 3
MLAAMLTLPEILMLFALHDDKGTLHPSAFMAIDHGLRGACLCEMRLRKIIQTRKNGEIRRHPTLFKPTGHPILDPAIEILATSASPAGVETWLDLLREGLPNMRKDITRGLEAQGILGETDRERVLLPGSITHPMTDPNRERAMLDQIRKGARAGKAVQPRIGTLISLVSACNLIEILFDADDHADARHTADWVVQRDAISRAVREQVARSEGTW